MTPDEVHAIAERARAIIARVDATIEEVKTMERDAAIAALVELTDDLIVFTHRDLTVSAAFRDATLAELHGEVEQRKDAVHRAWSNITSKMN